MCGVGPPPPTVGGFRARTQYRIGHAHARICISRPPARPPARPPTRARLLGRRAACRGAEVERGQHSEVVRRLRSGSDAYAQPAPSPGRAIPRGRSALDVWGGGGGGVAGRPSGATQQLAHSSPMRGRARRDSSFHAASPAPASAAATGPAAPPAAGAGGSHSQSMAAMHAGRQATCQVPRDARELLRAAASAFCPGSQLRALPPPQLAATRAAARAGGQVKTRRAARQRAAARRAGAGAGAYLYGVRDAACPISTG